MNLKKTIIFLCLFSSLRTYPINIIAPDDNIKKSQLYVFNSSSFVSQPKIIKTNSKKIKNPKNKKSFSKVTLVSPYKALSHQTKKIPIGLWITMEPGWHSYWQNPGESGKSLKVKWNLPKGFSMSPLKWPLPERIAFGSLTNFGYKKSFLLISHLSLPKKPINKQIYLSGQVEWLICEKVCIPLTNKVQLEWAIKNTEKVNLQWENTFHHWSKQLPIDVNKKITLHPTEDKWQAYVYTNKKLQLIDLFPLSKNTFFLSSVLSKKDHQHSFLIKPDFSSLSSSNTNNQNKLFSSSQPSLNKSKALLVFQEANNKLGFIYTFQKKTNMLWFLLLAFLGGLLLNLMPCVLPIVFLKLSNTIEQSKQKTSSIILSNLFYSIGVICSFLLLALILLFLKKGGESIGWGFQMQSPYFLLSIIFLFIFVSFHFTGWLSFPSLSVPFLHKGKSLFKHFLTGSLSTTAASPCTAPFMGAAIGYAFSESTIHIMMIFFFLGLGLSFPYLLLSIFPRWIKYIPFPGKWSNKLKHFMAFPMLATCIWLIHLFNKQKSTDLLPLLFSLLFIYLGFWMLNNLKKRNWLTWLSYTIILTSVIYPFINIYQDVKLNSPKIEWESFSIEKMEKLQSEGKAVFVNFTADWCLTCKFNEQITFKNQRVIRVFTDKKIYSLKGDWTHKNPEITNVLESYQRSGIPFYLYFPPESPSAIVLPELLTPRILLKYLNRSDLQN